MTHIEADQAYKIVNAVNNGMIVLPAAIAPAHGAIATAFGLARDVKRKVASLVLPEQRFYVPYGLETDIHVLGAIILGNNNVRFCNIIGVLPGEEFHGCAQRIVHADKNVVVQSTIPICGIEPGSFRNAHVRFFGDGTYTRAVIQDLVPVAKA